MADFRQQAPDVQPMLRDTRLYSRVATEGGTFGALAAGANALASGLNNVGRARQNQAALEADAEQKRIANDTALGLFNENAEFVDTNNTRIEQSLAAGVADEENLAALSRSERAVRLLGLAEGQGRGDSFTRARALQQLNGLISRDPGNAAAYMANFKELTGETYFDSVVAARREAQELEISASENAVEEYQRLTTLYGYPPGTDPKVVFDYHESLGSVSRNLSTLQKSLSALEAEKGIDAITQQRSFNQIGTELSRTANFGVQRVLMQYPNPEQMSREDRMAAITEVQETLSGILNNTISTFDMLDLTQQQLLDRNPQIQAQLDLAIGYLDGSVSRDMAKADLDYFKTTPQIDRMKDPTFRRLYGDMSLLNDFNAPWIDAESASKLRGQSSVILSQLIPLFDNALTTPDPSATVNPPPSSGEDTGGFSIGIPNVSLGATGRRYISERGVALRDPNTDMSSALSYLGLMLSPEGKANLSQQSGAALGVIGRLSNSMTRNADNIPVDYYRQFAQFTASEDGWKAFQTATEMDDEIFDGFVEGYNEYLARTAAAMAEDLRDDTIEGIRSTVRVGEGEPETLFSFLGINVTSQRPGGPGELRSVGNTITYSILEDGSIAFKPRTEYTSDANVNRRVRMLNNKYSSVIQNQVKSFAHIINKDQDYVKAFEDLFTSGEFAINNQEEVLLTRFRREYPEFADKSDDEIRAALGGGR